MDDEVERRLWNWVRWRAGGCGDGRFVQIGGSGLVSSVYRIGPKVRRSGYAQASFPVLVSEAQATESAIKALPTELCQALHAWYLRRSPDNALYTVDWTQAEIAAHLGVPRRTFQWRIERACDCLSMVFGRAG